MKRAQVVLVGVVDSFLPFFILLAALQLKKPEARFQFELAIDLALFRKQVGEGCLEVTDRAYGLENVGLFEKLLVTHLEQSVPPTLSTALAPACEDWEALSKVSDWVEAFPNCHDVGFGYVTRGSRRGRPFLLVQLLDHVVFKVLVVDDAQDKSGGTYEDPLDAADVRDEVKKVVDVPLELDQVQVPLDRDFYMHVLRDLIVQRHPLELEERAVLELGEGVQVD